MEHSSQIPGFDPTIRILQNLCDSIHTFGALSVFLAFWIESFFSSYALYSKLSVREFLWILARCSFKFLHRWSLVACKYSIRRLRIRKSQLNHKTIQNLQGHWTRCSLPQILGFHCPSALGRSSAVGGFILFLAWRRFSQGWWFWGWWPKGKPGFWGCRDWHWNARGNDFVKAQRGDLGLWRFPNNAWPDGVVRAFWMACTMMRHC